MPALESILNSTVLTSRPGNGPFGFLFQSDAAASLLGQCGLFYLIAFALLLPLAVIATAAEGRVSTGS